MKVSVVIPTYNGERTIRRAIESVIAQTAVAEFEILICDDCSTDGTLAIASKYPQCQLFANHEHSGGPNAGRNMGIKHATGEVIAFLDQDDEWLSDKVQNQLKQLNEGYEFIYSPCVKVME